MSTQFGLFHHKDHNDKKTVSGPEKIRALDAELTSIEQCLKFKPYTDRERRQAVLRGFVGLYFRMEPEAFTHRPLECLGGKTLASLVEDAWPVVKAWMAECRLHPDEQARLLAYQSPLTSADLETP